MADLPDPIEARIHRDVAEFGWHVLKILPAPGTDLQWAYSIGVFRSLHRPEICVFGLDLADAHAIIEKVVDAIGGPEETRVDVDYTRLLAEDRPCRLRPVERQWYDAFFGRAVDFYGGRGFPMLQLFWADAAGNYPWNDEFDTTASQRQPRLDAADQPR